MSAHALKRLRERFANFDVMSEFAVPSGLAVVILICMVAFAALMFIKLPSLVGNHAVDPQYLESASPCVKSKLRADSDAGRLITSEAFSVATNECLAMDQARALSQ
jgi:hypothetical protein